MTHDAADLDPRPPVHRLDPDSEIDDLNSDWPNSMAGSKTSGRLVQGRVENARSLVDYWDAATDWRRFDPSSRFPQFLTELTAGHPLRPRHSKIQRTALILSTDGRARSSSSEADRPLTDRFRSEETPPIHSTSCPSLPGFGSPRSHADRVDCVAHRKPGGWS